MRLDRLVVTDFRNIARAELQPAPRLTVLCGANGQGKTNLLEAIWLLTGGKSFRGARDAELIRRGAEFSVLEAQLSADGRDQQARLTVGAKGTQKPGRTVRLNGADRGRAASIAGTFTAVVFDPNHLSLVKGGPEGRRRFLDAALCQLYPGYLAASRRYLRVVAQKNALLKAYDITPGGDVLLETYNEALAGYGSEVVSDPAGTRRRGQLPGYFPGGRDAGTALLSLLRAGQPRTPGRKAAGDAQRRAAGGVLPDGTPPGGSGYPD